MSRLCVFLIALIVLVTGIAAGFIIGCAVAAGLDAQDAIDADLSVPVLDGDEYDDPYDPGREGF